jgi:hypothetical protein
MFWLNGMAGTGKSTISRTVAWALSERGQLGASFFFKRGDGDRGKIDKFFTTIAAQLVTKEPAVAVHIKNAIDSDRTVVRKVMREQFEKLVLEPLSKISQDVLGASSLIIVVDALDECERDEDIRVLINLFSLIKTLKSPRLKIFITSRPDLPIRLGFKAIKGVYQDLFLHEIPELVVEHDIGAFLKDELARIRDAYNASVSEDRQLPDDWPGQSNVQGLVKMAIPLFIFAATICRFLGDRKCGSPNKQLGKVLEYQTRSQESKLDATYLPVLDQLLVGLSSRERDQVLEQFRTIVGSIIILFSPLSTTSLACILRIDQEDIDSQLDLLHSVLSVPPSSKSPVRLLHLSFRDFLLDPEKREINQFWVDEEHAHKQMAANCLRIMGEHLRADMCQLQWPGTSRSAIDPKLIENRLPPEVQYACLYWAHHLTQAKSRIRDGDLVDNFLTRHFLHYLEILSLIGRTSESISILKTLQSLLEVGRFNNTTRET